MEARDTVRKLFTEDGQLWVSFRGHAGYYRVPLSNAALCAAIRAALDRKEEIHFEHDRDLIITSVH